MSACARCGRDPALGFATINERRYCHGEEKLSCYEQATQELARDPLAALAPQDAGG